MNIRKYFKQQDRFNLVVQYVYKYLYNHVLLHAVLAFVIFPKNRKGLELFREYMNIKIYSKIRRAYKKPILKFFSSIEPDNNNRRKKEKIIWLCWLQGIENSPQLVQQVYKSITKQCSDYKIVTVTAENYREYTDLPEYIITKWNQGIISNTHFSDILRTNLLVRHGGFWIDVTVLLTEKIPSDIGESSLFFFRTFKPAANGHCINLSSWFIRAEAEHPVMKTAQHLLFLYWKKHRYICDYFLYHIFLEIIFELRPDYIGDMPKYTNETPHLMQFELGKEFSIRKWDSITAQTFCHKLTYKLNDTDREKNGTFYRHILEGIQ